MNANRWKLHSAATLGCAVLLLGAAADGATKYKVLHDFTGGADGYGYSAVILGPGGSLYGPALGGGTGKCQDTCGLIFQLVPHANGKWTEAVLYDFQAGGDANNPSGALAFDPSGNIYGTTQYGGAYNWGTVFEVTQNDGRWAEDVLYSFCGPPPCVEGGVPKEGVVRDATGNLFGTAGVAFELSPGSGGWQETVLHDFTGQNGDGEAPGAVILDRPGNLYGTTELGGVQCGSSTCGTAYELSPQADGKWKETILHRFDDNGKDGVNPNGGGLHMDALGNLYGATEGGGRYFCGGDIPMAGAPARGSPRAQIGNCGTIFELSRDAKGRWKERILYSFTGGAGGYLPASGAAVDTLGNLYGVTEGGGGGGCGVIYRLAPRFNRWKYTVLHSFSGPDGCVPAGNLAIDKHGNLYGGAVLGGKYDYGVVFEITP